MDIETKIKEIENEIKGLEEPGKRLLALKAERESLYKQMKQKGAFKPAPVGTSVFLCPYCGRKQTLTTSEVRGLNHCNKCGKGFYFWVEKKDDRIVPVTEKVEVMAEKRKKIRDERRAKKYGK
jgi:uncharacterized radical SAM superfamily Fe-S cluster-containing enzyme